MPAIKPTSPEAKSESTTSASFTPLAQTKPAVHTLNAKVVGGVTLHYTITVRHRDCADDRTLTVDLLKDAVVTVAADDEAEIFKVQVVSFIINDRCCITPCERLTGVKDRPSRASILNRVARKCFHHLRPYNRR